MTLRSKLLLLPLISLIVLVGCTSSRSSPSSQLRQETDDRETLQSIALVDVSAKVDEYMNSMLAQSRLAINPSGAPWNPDLTARFLTEFAKRAASSQAGSGLGVRVGDISFEISKLTKAECTLINTLDVDKHEILAIKFANSRYSENPVSLIDGKFPSQKTPLTADHSMSPIIRLGTVLIGLDKIGHFLEQGWWYHQAEQKGLLLNYEERWAFGQFMEGDDALPESERPRYQDIYAEFCWVCTLRGGFGFFGARSTGVISFADIQANESGYQFFRDLARDPGGYKFEASALPVHLWNEETSPSKYMPGLKARN